MIFLVGYRGTGKTTVARVLAERIGWGWLFILLVRNVAGGSNPAVPQARRNCQRWS